MAVVLTYICELSEGIHARPAGYIARLCHLFQATIDWENTRTGLQANAKSALSLIATDTLLNDECRISLSGNDEQNAAAQLHALLCDLPTFSLAPAPVTSLGYLPRCLRELNPQVIQGTRINKGAAIAKPRVVQSLTFADIIEQNPGHVDHLEDETARLIAGLDALRAEKETALGQTHGVERELIEAHLSLITDMTFRDKAIGYLSNNINAWSAIAQAALDFCHMLERSSSHYIQERTLDILDIATQLICTLYGEQALAHSPLTLNEPAIVFANHLTPSQFLALDKNRIAGLVLSSTGKTSHTAILARALSIPTLTDIDMSSLKLEPERQIIIDGEPGILITHPDEKTLRYYRQEIAVQQAMQQLLRANASTPAQTGDGQRIEIAANIASLAEAQAAFDNGAQSIGLFRTEITFMGRDTPPTCKELADLYTQVIILAAGKTVIFRTFDIGGDKPVEYLSSDKEKNPFLGFRAVRTYPHYRDLFAAQLKAILIASAAGQAKIMLPMITRVEELLWCREVLESVKQEMRGEGLAFDEAIALGIMLEVPSVLFAMAEMAEYADFFSVGSNDLTQYFFAADRGNAQVKSLYDSYAPPFLRALQFAVSEAHRAGKPIGLCGELAADAPILPLLIGIGFDELSMNCAAIPRIKNALRKLNVAGCQTLTQTLLASQRADQVKAILQSSGGGAAKKPLLSPEMILWNIDAADKNEAIKMMVDNLWLRERTDERDRLCDDIWAREVPFPTVVGSGFAIPHAQTDYIHDSAISVATLKQPIAWGGVMVDTLFMLTISNSAQDNEHMKYFSTLARMLMNDEFVSLVKEMKNPKALYNLISRTLAF
ncbi:phosphoenolpyruvate--protein phosphotransferase [Klebsiella sp. RHBSTW-00484]|uniref:phosphoenolpyruvate--protein phosphotransferase n=1 Tax=unclassified Klebsiella TaxID=2608929 RepID=UPI0015E51549|nr:MULTISPECIES: phosphoenolpyruvate--protein phosphotransferase [unclassified Klebsiella]MBA7847460.1 phosphoenolpyruvate--protein phosphotransferase [Klebsiella sp. RHBSTW-00465]QLO36656.1 phosphoenolpyruvate--protein phosphotransferase [Klebsiella sp. RHBSTW-00484]QLT76175.1 phosphoenolpyruvate--protein phosphotransferase [Klebsiella sp. RHBSTW-00464]